MTKQYVWLVRYGKTEFPLVEYDGPFDSDIDPVDGVVHANCIAKEVSTSSFKPDKVYASPFMRTTHTASILANHLLTAVNVEEGLHEYLQPSLLVDQSGTRTYPRSIENLKKVFDNVDTSYESCLAITREMFPENEETLIERMRLTLNGILKHASFESNVAIVAHAPCVQALAYIMEAVDSFKSSKLTEWPQGGITRFSRKSEDSAWEMDFYGSSEHMPGEYKNGAGLWSLPCFVKAVHPIKSLPQR